MSVFDDASPCRNGDVERPTDRHLDRPQKTNPNRGHLVSSPASLPTPFAHWHQGATGELVSSICPWRRASVLFLFGLSSRCSSVNGSPGSFFLSLSIVPRFGRPVGSVGRLASVSKHRHLLVSAPWWMGAHDHDRIGQLCSRRLHRRCPPWQ